MHVVVAGASGLIGSALVDALRARGDEVTRLVRREPTRADERQWDPSEGALDPAHLGDADAVVNLCGVGVGDHRWTSSYKELIRSSRVESTTLLARTLAALAAQDQGPTRWLNASAVGYYGDRGDSVLSETSGPGDGFLADVCRDWEAATTEAADAGVSVAVLRTGIVLAPDGGALAQLRRLTRAGLGGPLGSGKQWWPTISLVDEVGAILHLLDRPEITGPVNVVGPAPIPQRDLAHMIGQRLRRPTLLPAPSPAMRLVAGEFADDLLASQRAIPSVLLGSGFTFEHGTLSDALTWALELEQPPQEEPETPADDSGSSEA